MVEVPDPLPSSEHRYGRRGFLLLVAGGASSLLWAGPISSFLSPLTSAGSQLVGNLFPVGGWRIYTISGSMPIFDPASWRLEVGGLVKRPRTLTYDQLTALPRAEQTSTFHCVTGWTVKNVHWTGVRFQQLFDLVQPLPSATAVRFVSMERPYDDSLRTSTSTPHWPGSWRSPPSASPAPASACLPMHVRSRASTTTTSAGCGGAATRKGASTPARRST